MALRGDRLPVRQADGCQERKRPAPPGPPLGGGRGCAGGGGGRAWRLRSTAAARRGPGRRPRDTPGSTPSSLFSARLAVPGRAEPAASRRPREEPAASCVEIGVESQGWQGRGRRRPATRDLRLRAKSATRDPRPPERPRPPGSARTFVECPAGPA